MSTLARLLTAKAQQRKPRGPAELNRHSPQAAGLNLWYPIWVDRPDRALIESTTIPDALQDLSGHDYHLDYNTTAGAGAVPGVFNDPIHGPLHQFTNNVDVHRFRRVGGHATNVIGLSAITVTGWVRYPASITGGKDPRIFEYAASDSADDIVWMLSFNSNSSFRLRLRAGGSTITTIESTTATIAQNTFYHLGFTYDGANVRIYRDAIETGSAAKTGTISAPGAGTAGVDVGNSAGESNDSAQIVSDLRQYNRCLTPEEIWQVRNRPFELILPRRVVVPVAPLAVGGTTHEVALTVAAFAGLAEISQAQFESGLALDTVQTVADVSQANFESAASMAMAQTVVAAAQAVYEPAFSAAVSAALSFSSGAGVFEVALTQAASHGVSLAGQSTLAAALSLTSTYGLATASIITIDGALSLAATAGLQAAVSAAFDGQTVVAADFAVAPTATGVLEGAVTLATVATATPTVIGTFEVAVALANINAVDVGSGLEFEVALSLGAQLGVALAAAIAISSPTPTTRVIELTGGRTITITTTPRTHTIAANPRTHTIN